MIRFAALLSSAALVVSAFALVPAVQAQRSASLRGRVLDAAGRADAHAMIRLVSDTATTSAVHPQRYTLLGDALGKFSQEGIAPGAYLVMLFTDGKGTDVLRRVLLKPGDAAVLELQSGSHALQLAGATLTTAVR